MLLVDAPYTDEQVLCASIDGQAFPPQMMALPGWRWPSKGVAELRVLWRQAREPADERLLQSVMGELKAQATDIDKLNLLRAVLRGPAGLHMAGPSNGRVGDDDRVHGHDGGGRAEAAVRARGVRARMRDKHTSSRRMDHMGGGGKRRKGAKAAAAASAAEAAAEAARADGAMWFSV